MNIRAMLKHVFGRVCFTVVGIIVIALTIIELVFLTLHGLGITIMSSCLRYCKTDTLANTFNLLCKTSSEMTEDFSIYMDICHIEEGELD